MKGPATVSAHWLVSCPCRNFLCPCPSPELYGHREYLPQLQVAGSSFTATACALMHEPVYTSSR